MLNPSPSEKPQPSVPEGLYDTESGLPANAEKPQQGTPRTDAVCDTPIMGTACTPHKWDKLQEHARQLELELSQACLERDSARNVLARAIERERLANMRADQAEEARDASQSATGRSEPYGYVWFNRHMEQRFTHLLPHQKSSEQPIGEVIPVYKAPPVSASATTWISDCLRLAIRQNSHDMLLTGDELRRCEAALATADKTASDKGQG
jgi:hypothetical protein